MEIADGAQVLNVHVCFKQEKEENKCYLCPFCSESFTERVLLDIHTINRHSSDYERHTCNYCGKSFGTMQSYERHMEVCNQLRSTTKTVFQCYVCSAKFEKNSVLQKHIIREHPTIDQFMCPTCEKSFIDDESLQVHLRTHVKGTMRHVNDETKTDSCKATASSEAGAESVGENSSESRVKVDDEEGVDGCREFICNLCKKGFKTEARMIRHKLLHTEGDSSLSCQLCTEVFQCARDLYTHRRRHKTCPLCGKVAARYENLQSHMRIHTGEKPFKCEVCGKTFNHSANKRRHVLTHTEYKPYGCDKCDEKFALKTELKTHFKIHSGEKPFRCHVCAKAFKEKGQLQLHKEIHNTQTYSFVWKTC